MHTNTIIQLAIILFAAVALIWVVYTAKQFSDAENWLNDNKSRIIRALDYIGYDIHKSPNGVYISQRGQEKLVGKPCGVLTFHKYMTAMLETKETHVRAVLARRLLLGGK